METIVRKIAKGQKPFADEMTKLDVFGGGGLFWNVKKDRAIWELHRDLVRQVHPLQDELIMKQHAPYVTGEADVDALKRRALHLYGNPLANPDSMTSPFWPHVTITSCKTKKQAEALAKTMDIEPMEFEVQSIHITDVGPSGTCPGSLAEIPLNGTLAR